MRRERPVHVICSSSISCRPSLRTAIRAVKARLMLRERDATRNSEAARCTRNLCRSLFHNRRSAPPGPDWWPFQQCGIGAVNSSLCSSRLISDQKCHGRDVRATSSLNGDMRCEIPFAHSTLQSRRARAAACLVLRDCYSTGDMRRNSPYDLHSLSEGCQ